MNGYQRSAKAATQIVAAESARTASAREMMAELDAIAAERGIKWTGAEVANVDTSTRTRYAIPGQRCGSGRVRHLSDRQVAFIKRLMAERDTTNLVRLPGSEDIEHISLRGATDLIDRLLACPELPASQRPAAPKATEKQVSFIQTLVEQTGFDWTSIGVPIEDLPKARASKAIEHLLKLPKVARPAVAATTSAPAVEVDEGRYAVEVDGVLKFYKIDKPTEGRWSGYTFLKVQASDDFYPVKSPASKAAIFALIAADAKAATIRYGQELGVCGVCGRTLTDEASRAAGIGPVCAAKKSW